MRFRPFLLTEVYFCVSRWYNGNNINMEDKFRCCENCRAPCAGDFKKVVDLQYSGLVIYLHTKKDKQFQEKAGTSKCDDSYIVHNTGSKPLKKLDYITELRQFKTKCGQCKTIVQRVRSLLDEIKAIKENEIIGVCERCKRANLDKCKRCEFIVSKFISITQKKREEKQERFKIWLCKVKHLLQAILDGESVCQHKVYKDAELERILQELRKPLSMREPDIDFFPSLDLEKLSSLKRISENKEMLEKLLSKIKLEGERHFTSEESLYPSTSESCLCKYLKEGHFLGLSEEQSQMMVQSEHKDKALASSKSGYQDVEQTVSMKQLLGEEKKDSPSNEREIQQRSTTQDTSLSSETRRGSHKTEREKLKSPLLKSVIKEKSHDSHKVFPKETTQVSIKVKDKEEIQGVPKKDINRIAKFQTPSQSKEDQHLTASRELSSGLSSKAGARDVNQRRLKDSEREISRKGISKTKTKTSKGEDILSYKDKDKGNVRSDKSSSKTKTKTSKGDDSLSYKDKDKGNVKYDKSSSKTKTKTSKGDDSLSYKDKDKGNVRYDKSSPKSKTKTSKGDDSLSYKDKEKADIKYDETSSKTKFSKKATQASSLEQKEKKKYKDPSIKSQSKDKQGLPFEDEGDFSINKAIKDKKGLKKKPLSDKMSKESKKLEESKEKENIKPIKREPKRAAKQISASILLNLLKANREKAAQLKEYKEKQLARQKEMERRRLKALSRPIRRVKPKEAPPISPYNSILDCNMAIIHKTKEMIKGDVLVPYKDAPPGDKSVEPLFYSKKFNFGDGQDEIKAKRSESIDNLDMYKDGVLRYQLSDRTFIDNGMTRLPTEKIMRRMNVYKMEPVNPKQDWFERHKDQKLFYNDGSRLAAVDSEGRGRWYYRNGSVALDYYNTSESNMCRRYVVYSSGEEMYQGKLRPRTVLALFDLLGNGVLYDHSGNIRLKYNQSEGVILDPKLGPPGRWKWHTLNDPPVLQQVFVNTYMKVPDPELDLVPNPLTSKDATSPKKEIHPDMLAIELDNYLKEKNSKLNQKFKPFQIKMKAVKLNEYFSVKILDQANVYLVFRDRMSNLKLNLGLLLVSDEIIDTDTSDMSDVATPYDRQPARTSSIENIQKLLKAVQRF